MQTNTIWETIRYNLFYNYNKKELKMIYNFINSSYKRAKKLNKINSTKKSNIKVQETSSLIIGETAIRVDIANTNHIHYIDTMIGEIEINITFLNSMRPNKINQINADVNLSSMHNCYGGLSLIDCS